MHASRKPCHCPICGKACRQASHLNTHKRTHWKGTQPSPSTSRRTSENWKWHMKSIFSQESLFICHHRKSLQTPMIHYQILKLSVMNEVSCSTRAKSIIKVSSLVKTNSEGVVSCKKKRSFNYAEYALQTWSLIVGLGHTDVFYVAKYSHRRVTWYLMSKHVGTATKFQTVSKVKWKMPAYVQISVFKHVFIVQIWMPNQTKVTVC